MNRPEPAAGFHPQPANGLMDGLFSSRYAQPPVAAAAEDAAWWNRLACRPVDDTILHDAPAKGAPLVAGACSAAAGDIPRRPKGLR